MSRSPDGLNFKHCTVWQSESAHSALSTQLQRERYEPDIKLISNDVTRLTPQAAAGESGRLWAAYSGAAVRDRLA